MPTTYRILENADVKGKKVLLRAGFDVSIENGKVMDTERIEAIIPTIEHLLKNGASVILLSHQGRPKGKKDPAFTQEPVTAVIESFLQKTKVTFVPSCVGKEAEDAAKALKPGQVIFLENLRFEPGEEKNDAAFAKALAKLGDVYVNDAFTNCHREHASMVKLAELLPSYAGLQLTRELRHLTPVLEDPRRPLLLLISGAKMETKIPVIERFLGKGDDILLGGCIANTFLAARGFDVGGSKYEESFIPQAQEYMLEAEKTDKADIHIPRDAILATAPSDDAEKADLPVEDVQGDMAIYDIGKLTVERYKMQIAKAGMIVWNGPVGFYEVHAFSNGTKELAEAIAEATKAGATSIVGGGDTLDFHTRYGLPLSAYSFVSTGGGAMLEYLSGKRLPALKALEEGHKAKKE
jgi:phosphoglycerate kinase